MGLLMNIFQRVANYIRSNILPRKSVIVKDNGGWYGTNDFRFKAVDGLTLHKGEVVYFEIVGYVGEPPLVKDLPGSSTPRPIMPAQAVPKELPDIAKQYGPVMIYDYGCPAHESRIYVYKIARLNEDGIATELRWPQLVQRCSELGLAHVPLLAGPITIASLRAREGWHPDDKNADYFHAMLRTEVEQHTDGPSTLDAGHIREGVVIRTESKAGTQHIKNKAFVFGVLEGYLKLKDDFVDAEDVA